MKYNRFRFHPQAKLAAFLCVVVAQLSSCTISAPLQEGPAQEEPASGEYIVAVTHLRFAESASEIFEKHADVLPDLALQAPGNVSVTFRKNLATRDRWTMSTWTDMASMGAFVASPEHIQAIRDVMPGAEIVRTTQTTIPADTYPMSWDEALDLLEAQGIDR
jgi:quinol monooxygenase YgiN